MLTASEDSSSLKDNPPPMKTTHSQSSLNDVMSISATSTDLLSVDRATRQVEKFTAGSENFGQHATMSIIIPQKPLRSNTSSQSSSGADQMFSPSETSTQSYRTSDDAWSVALPTLPSACQRLEHSAARDRILVKNKRRQPIKQNLITLRETEDQEKSSVSFPTKEETILPAVEVTKQQLVVDSSILDTARTQLRPAVRPRDHSADNILTTVPITISSIQRSKSFKQPEEGKSGNRLLFQVNDEEEKKTHVSSQEHIYDNLDLFKRHKTSTEPLVQTRESSVVKTTRLRPVTMYIPTNSSTINEFENMFNQLKKRETILTETSPTASVDESSTTLPSNENVSLVVTTNSLVKLVSVSPVPNRRKTLAGADLSAKNKVAGNEEKPTPSWIDIAKQKQSKFQSTNHQEELDPPSIEPRKAMTSTSHLTLINENSSENTRLNRKSLYEPVITRRVSPARTSTNTEVEERDSIRVLKAGSPNRINNLIKLFNK